MKTNGNDTVFYPTPSTTNIDMYGTILSNGITKRELFAKDFMAAMLGNDAIYDRYDEYEIAEMAVHSTDILIAELNKEVQQ